MGRIAVSTAVYPAGMEFFEAYCLGLRRAIDRFDGGVRVLFMCDGVDPNLVSSAGELEGIEVDAVETTGGSAAIVRREMLCAAASLNVDAVVLFDIDDVPLDDGLRLHLTTLDKAEISFGDMRLIDANGEEFCGSFFSGAEVPQQVLSSSKLLERNFLGFTNTAIRRKCVLGSADMIPDDVIAVDWWYFCYLLENGLAARQTTDRVVSYRTHGASTLGGKAPSDVPALIRQCEIMSRHYERRQQEASVAMAAERVKLLRLRLQDDPEWVVATDRANVKRDVWFGRVSHLAKVCQEEK